MIGVFSFAESIRSVTEKSQIGTWEAEAESAVSFAAKSRTPTDRSGQGSHLQTPAWPSLRYHICARVDLIALLGDLRDNEIEILRSALKKLRHPR